MQIFINYVWIGNLGAQQEIIKYSDADYQQKYHGINFFKDYYHVWLY